MSYAAKHYVKISGRKYTPGEIIDIPIPEEKLKRLLRLKAIAPVPSAIADPADKNGEDGDDGEEARDNNRQPENLGNDPYGNLIPAEADEDEEPTEEADEEAPAPEIDVMDGIVTASEEAPKKKTSKGRKKA